tara:strand:+ start:830 stop:985 length:156 start_codon:yes stop_codon:yes gene_type:complete
MSIKHQESECIKVTDPIDEYFECVTACSLSDDGIECLTQCVAIHLKGEPEP